MRRILATAVAGLALLAAGTATAFAHVEVKSDKATAGATDVTLTFSVPNEKAGLSTTSVDLVLPSDHPLVGVSAVPQNGFTPTVTSRTVSTPVPGRSGPVTEVADRVTFSGGTITGTEEKPFAIRVDKLPDGVSSLTFKAIQHYSDGSTVAWIEVAADGQAEPENPAPVLTLTVPAGQSASASPVASTAATASPSPASATAGSSSPWPWIALVAIFAVAGVVVAVRTLLARGRH
ncbi:YcnI family protein [Raineyella fluvialis]|nr:YcnI family protein [Raineyella fluvialis]